MGRLDGVAWGAGPILFALGVTILTTGCSRSKSHESTEIHAVSEVVSAKASASAVVEKPRIVDFAVGGAGVCVRQSDGSIACWDGRRPDPRSTPGLGARHGVGIARHHKETCVLFDNDDVDCSGEFGSGNANPFMTLAARVGDRPVLSVATSAEEKCVLTGSGCVRCWGSNQHGLAGVLPFRGGESFYLPAEIPTLTHEAQIAMGRGHACARRSDGSVRCWGLNEYGQLGDGSTAASPLPVEVTFLLGHAAQIAAGDDTTCALLVDGRVKCWGSNLNHALGDGSTDAYRTSPVEVSGAKGALWIAMGGTSACVGMPAGRVRCWGNNFDGQLGDGTFESRSTPTDAIALQGAHAMALGDDAGCALFDNDVPKCWGSLAVDGRVPTVLDLSSIAPASPP
jgi:alpha-tubulin suppressor-like RCC1 family protein